MHEKDKMSNIDSSKHDALSRENTIDSLYPDGRILVLNRQETP